MTDYKSAFCRNVYGLALLACLFIALPGRGQIPAATIPRFDFYRFDKTAFTNENIEPGKPAFIIFFDTDCEHCQRALKQLSDNYPKYKSAAIYLVTLDGPEKVKGFFAKFAPNLVGKKNITVLQDAKNEFISRFGPRKYPALFLYSKDRKLIAYNDEETSMPNFAKLLQEAVK